MTFTYDPSIHDPGRGPRPARVHPWYIEPSLATHALYLFGFDETRDAAADVQDRADPRPRADRRRPSSRRPQSVEDAFVNAWDIIADQPVVEVVLRFDPAIAARVQEATWHPSQRVEPEPDGSLIWRGRVSGTIEIRLWILSWGQQVEVLEPGRPARRRRRDLPGGPPVRGNAGGRGRGIPAVRCSPTRAIATDAAVSWSPSLRRPGPGSG